MYMFIRVNIYEYILCTGMHIYLYLALYIHVEYPLCEMLGTKNVRFGIFF
jgi:hypothetical protein